MCVVVLVAVRFMGIASPKAALDSKASDASMSDFSYRDDSGANTIGRAMHCNLVSGNGTDGVTGNSQGGWECYDERQQCNKNIMRLIKNGNYLKN